jgi:hypothetical protein
VTAEGAVASADAQVEAVLSACGIAPTGVQRIATGAQSDVWLVETESDRYALRLGVARAGEHNSYEPEFAIYQAISDDVCVR